MVEYLLKFTSKYSGYWKACFFVLYLQLFANQTAFK